MDDEGKLILELVMVLGVREKRSRNKILLEYLMKWKNISLEDEMWEGVAFFIILVWNSSRSSNLAKLSIQI